MALLQSAGLNPEEAIVLFGDLQKARQGLATDDDVHVLFLVARGSEGLFVKRGTFATMFEHAPTALRRIGHNLGVKDQ